MRRKKSYKSTIFISILLLLIGTTFGYYGNIWTSRDGNNPSIEPIENKTMPVREEDKSEKTTNISNVSVKDTINEPESITSEQVPRVATDTVMIFERNYLQCGHKTSEKQTATEGIVNLTEEELEIVYPQWEIQSFSSNQVILTADIDEKCLKHYIVREYDGKIGVYYQSTIIENPLKQVVDINVSQLREEDRIKLKNGIFVDSDKALAQLIEDFMS